MVANLVRGQLNRENKFPSPGSRLRLWSHELSSANSSCITLLILPTEAESGAYLRGSNPPSRIPHAPTS